MPNFEHFAHFFAVMCHINIAAMGLVLFFYEHIHTTTKEKAQNSLARIRKTLLSIDERSKDDIKTSVDNDKFWKPIWLIIERRLKIRKLRISIANFTLSISQKSLDKIQSESHYIKRYFPLFFVVGLYCLVMLILSAMITEFEGHTSKGFSKDVHLSKIVIQWSWISIYLYTIFYFLIPKIFPKKQNLIFINVLIFLIACFLPFLLFEYIDYTYFHNVCTLHPYIFLWTVIVVTILPTVNLARKYAVYKTVIYIGETHYNKKQDQNGTDLDEKLGDI